MRDMMRLAIRLMLITLVAGLALGATYAVTKGPIDEQAAEASLKARQQVLSADEFVEIDLEKLESSSSWIVDFDNVVSAYFGKKEGQTDGMAVELIAKGFGGDITMTVGIDMEGKITGITVTSNSETVGLGAKITLASFQEQFKGLDASQTVGVSSSAGGNNIKAISGATISSRAVASGTTVAGKFFAAYKDTTEVKAQ